MQQTGPLTRASECELDSCLYQCLWHKHHAAKHLKLLEVNNADQALLLGVFFMRCAKYVMDDNHE